jgi:hypothetical protein
VRPLSVGLEMGRGLRMNDTNGEYVSDGRSVMVENGQVGHPERTSKVIHPGRAWSIVGLWSEEVVGQCTLTLCAGMRRLCR